MHFLCCIIPDGAATESSLNKKLVVRNSNCQEFWNSEPEQESQIVDIRDGALERGDGTFYIRLLTIGN